MGTALGKEIARFPRGKRLLYAIYYHAYAQEEDIINKTTHDIIYALMPIPVMPLCEYLGFAQRKDDMGRYFTMGISII